MCFSPGFAQRRQRGAAHQRVAEPRHYRDGHLSGVLPRERADVSSRRARRIQRRVTAGAEEFRIVAAEAQGTHRRP